MFIYKVVFFFHCTWSEITHSNTDSAAQLLPQSLGPAPKHGVFSSLVSPQEPVVQPARRHASVFHPQILAAGGAPLRRWQCWQSGEARGGEGFAVPRRQEPVAGAGPAGAALGPDAGSLRPGPV